MTLKTAKSYEGCKWIGEPFKENGKMYVMIEEVCGRCGGQGKVAAWGHVDGGRCFECHGLGKYQRKVRLYTESQLESQAKAKEKKEAEKRRQREETSEAAKQEWFEHYGFNEDGITWCVCGDDTYAIKDWLKEKGCKYDPLFKWHIGEEIELPEGYTLVEIKFDETYIWDVYDHAAYPKEDIKLIVDKRLQQAQGVKESEYYGEVGQRFRNITAVYKGEHGFSGRYGWTHIYTFEHKKAVLVWFTQKELELEKGDIIDLTATVKCHEEYRGVKTTQLSRAIIKEV